MSPVDEIVDHFFGTYEAVEYITSVSDPCLTLSTDLGTLVVPFMQNIPSVTYMHIKDILKFKKLHFFKFLITFLVMVLLTLLTLYDRLII